MKKFIACLLVVSLLLSVTASAAGVDDTYTVDEDVTVVSMLAANASDYSVMATSSSWSTELGALNSIDEAIWDIKSDVSLMEGYLESIDTDIGLSLFDMELDISSMELDLGSLESFLTSTNTASSLYATLVKANEPVVDGLEDLLSELVVFNSLTQTALGTSGSLYSILSIINGRLTNSTGDFLNASGVVGSIGGTTPITTLLRLGFLGVGNLLRSDAGSAYLALDGTQSLLPGSAGVGMLLRNGFLGLRSTIAGAETDNVYNGLITSNENTSTAFSATGLGPMLNKWLGAVQLDTGRLSYMFASPTDLDVKAKSESATQAATDSFLDPESESSISVDDIGSISGASKNIQQLGQTGVSPDQAFEQLTGDGFFGYFTQETASDLNSTVQTLSDDPDQQITNYYAQSRVEFYSLIGKEE